MVTLRFEDHIGRVEWVTCHVPESQSVVGGVKLLVVGRGDVVGGRRVICCAAMGSCYGYGYGHGIHRGSRR